MIRSPMEVLQNPNFVLRLIVSILGITVLSVTQLSDTIFVNAYYHSFLSIVIGLLIECIFFTKTLIIEMGLLVVSLLKLFLATTTYIEINQSKLGVSQDEQNSAEPQSELMQRYLFIILNIEMKNAY